jgi:hypothetical protein
MTTRWAYAYELEVANTQDESRVRSQVPLYQILARANIQNVGPKIVCKKSLQDTNIVIHFC